MAAFTPSGSGGAPQLIEITGVNKSNPLVTVLTVTNTETTVILPAGTWAYQLKCRDVHKLSIGSSSGGDTFTLWPGCSWKEEHIKYTGSISLYITSSQPSSVVELVTWAAV